MVDNCVCLSVWCCVWSMQWGFTPLVLNTWFLILPLMRMQYQKDLHSKLLLLLWNIRRAEKWVFIGQKFLGGKKRQISIFVDWNHELCRRQLPPAAPKHYKGDESEPKSRKLTNNGMKDAVKRLRTIREPQSQLVIVCAFVTMSENLFITYSHLIHFLFF